VSCFFGYLDREPIYVGVFDSETAVSVVFYMYSVI